MVAQERDAEARRLEQDIADRARASAGAPAPNRVAVTDDVREAHAAVIDRLLARRREAEAREWAELAVRQGVWRHPLQRPIRYLPSLPPEPVHDADGFWFTAYLAANHEKLRAELEAVTDPRSAGFWPVDEPLVGRGHWDQVVLYEGGHRFEEACRRFPVTAEVVAAIPEATTFGPGVVSLSWLHPGTWIVPHCGVSNGHLRVHFGLQVPDGVRIRVGEEWLRWVEGQCLVFDDSFEHEVVHEGTSPRVVLLLDVLHPALDEAERERSLSRRRTIDDRIVRYMADRDLSRIELRDGSVGLRPTEAADIRIRRFIEETGARAVELRRGRLHYERTANGQGPASPAPG